MGRLSSIVVFALVLLISEQIRGNDLVDELVPQIKTTDYQIWYVNPKYLRKLFGEIVKHNDTYNLIRMTWEVLVDLPEDIYFSVSVFASDPDYKNGDIIYRNDIPVCTESPDREKLQQFVVLPAEQLGGKCFKQGKYVYDDIGNFRFDLIIPDIQNISDYYYSDVTFFTKDELISNLTYYSEWGYLIAD